MLAHCNGLPSLIQPLRGGVADDLTSGGIALSPAIVVAYLMVKYDWTFEAAVDYVQAKRYCASPMNVGSAIVFLQLLTEMDLTLRAVLDAVERVRADLPCHEIFTE